MRDIEYGYDRRDGVIKQWNEQGGYGFIMEFDGRLDIFVHRSNLDDTFLRDGRKVPYVGDEVKFSKSRDVLKQKNIATNVTIVRYARNMRP